MLRMQDHFQDELTLLGVDPPQLGESATIQAYNAVLEAWRDGPLKKAFRARALELHPDKNPGDTKAAKRFKAMSNAYERLCSVRIRTPPQRERPRVVHGFAGSMLHHFGRVMVVRVVIHGAPTQGSAATSTQSWTASGFSS